MYTVIIKKLSFGFTVMMTMTMMMRITSQPLDLQHQHLKQKLGDSQLHHPHSYPLGQAQQHLPLQLCRGGDTLLWELLPQLGKSPEMGG